MSTRPDWVREKAVTTSDYWLYDTLATEVRRDVEQMNKLIPFIRKGESYHVEQNDQQTTLAVTCKIEGQDLTRGGWQLSVVGQLVRIYLPQEEGYRTPSLALEAMARWESGECVLVPRDDEKKRLRPWEVSKVLLERLFFPKS